MNGLVAFEAARSAFMFATGFDLVEDLPKEKGMLLLADLIDLRLELSRSGPISDAELARCWLAAQMDSIDSAERGSLGQSE